MVGCSSLRASGCSCATRWGGPSVGVVSKPQGGPLSDVVFAGPEMKTIYVTAGDKVYRRKLRISGFRP